jgi:acyl-CoA thioester hydrolase
MPSFVETFRGVVSQADCDHLGHMNVSRYFSMCGEAAVHLQNMLGITPDDVRQGRRLSLAVVRNESDFKAEIAVADGVMAFDTTFRVVLFDLVNRRAAEIPVDVRAKAEAMLRSGA